MAMSHANCGHPRTPVARAACRKAQAAGMASVQALVDDIVGAPAIVRTPKAKPITPMTFTVEPKGRRSRQAYDRMVEANMPQEFLHTVRLAKQEGWTLTSDVFQDNSNRVQISTAHGTLSLTWKGERSVVMYRPADTSVTTKIADVKTGIARLTGRN